ncbi:MAG: DUF4258 domain-containing protein [Deltaproteobacteria bacterium]
MDIEKIRSRIRVGKYSISFTHTEKLRERMIEAADVEEAIFRGSIIELYSDDPRGPSCLILGFGRSGKPLHIVCGNLEEEELLIITAYEPDPEEWENDWNTRKRGS